MSQRIKQAVCIVHYEHKPKKWYRISRSYITTLADSWRKVYGFKYLKIYEIVNYKKGDNHAIGLQIGYITKKGYKLDLNGLYPTQEQINFKTRNKM